MEMELICRSGNFAVVKFKDRNYPAIVIQGDTFNSLITRIKLAKINKDMSLIDEEIDNLDEILAYYSECLKKNNVSSPF